MDENKIIHVSTVVPNFQIFLDKFIERMKIEVRENLTRQITDRKSCILWSVKKTFISWKSLPISRLSLNDTVLRWIISDD